MSSVLVCNMSSEPITASLKCPKMPLSELCMLAENFNVGKGFAFSR